MTTATETTVIPSSELREGMIVHTYGMRLRLGPVSSREPGAYDNSDALTVYWANGTVLNPDEVTAAGFVPKSWWRDGWTCQGNDRKTWTVEKEAGE